MNDRLTELTIEPTTGLLADRGPSRRQVLVTGGVIVAAAAATAACGSSGATDTAAAPTPTDSAGAGAGGGAGAGASILTADIPVGGGQILTDQKVVVTQPAAGTFKAFSAVCTHKGCLVASITDATIACPCHGSTFSISDGSVTNGPATAPLAPAPITVSGDTITLA